MTERKMVSIGITIIIMCIISVFCQIAAYRNGVRDGYANPWLPHVTKQVRLENMVQGNKVGDSIVSSRG